MTSKPTCASCHSPRSISRRLMLGGVGGALGALLLPGRSRAATGDGSPHFFLGVVATGGIDSTYLFDARPMALTAAGLQQNYLAKEPAEWLGLNGGRTLVAQPAELLRPYLADLAIVNGVVMSTTFDGHDQNLNVLLTGSPFGGRSLLSHLNPDKPLDYLRIGKVVGAELLDTRFVPMRMDTAVELKASLAARSSAPAELDTFLEERYAAAATGTGRFSNGALALKDAVTQSKSLEQKIRSLAIPQVPPTPDLAQDLSLIGEFFRRGLSQGALLDVTGDAEYDVHAKDQAKLQGTMYQLLAGQMAQVIRFLKETQFDATRSLLDVTTVLFASEFSRSMRQDGLPVDKTGTDHNPLANSLILAGKGIRGGVVLGASDFTSPTETLSGAHLALDARKLKRMGRPIDLQTGLPTAEAPAEFDASKYLVVASVVNSLYSLFGVDPANYWSVRDSAGAAPVLNPLLR